MKQPKKGDEFYYVMPSRVCIAQWSDEASLKKALRDGYIFVDKDQAKRFSEMLCKVYDERIGDFKVRSKFK